MINTCTGRFRCGILVTALVVATSGLWSLTGRADETKQKAETKQKSDTEPKTLRELIDASKDWYELYPNSESDVPAKVLPALRWANNTRGSDDGVTLLYVHDGLPLAVCCVFPWGNQLEHGFGSMSREKIIARRDGAVVWQPQEPGVTFADIPGAGEPAGTRPARLRQMKALAERFHGTMTGWKTDSTDREELRLLPRPLFRYEPKEGRIVDGAVFAFVMGTDPEILLQVEAVKNGNKTIWQYAFVRRTSGRLEGRLDNSVVWRADQFPVQNDPRRAYFSRGVPLPPEIVLELAKQR